MRTEMIQLSQIRNDGGTQARAHMSTEAVDEYAAAMSEGAGFPPVTLFYDGKVYWLADGFHRCSAARQAGLVAIAAEVREGGLRDARLFAIGANAAHGVRRTNADKRMAVQLLLQDEEWSKWSNREIAKRCGVSDMTVGRIRNEQVQHCCTPPPTEQSAGAPSPATPDPAKVPANSPQGPAPAPPEIQNEPPAHRDPEPESQTTGAQGAPPPAPPDPEELEQLRAENEDLKSRLSEVSSLMADLQEELEAARRALDAEDLLAQFQKEIVRAQEAARITQSRNNGLMNENADLTQRLKSALRKIERLERQMPKEEPA